MHMPSIASLLLSLTAACVSAAVLTGCDSHAASTATPPGSYSAGEAKTRAQVFAQVKQMTSVGEKMFLDPSLSGSGKLACASCHSPEHAFGPPNALSVQLGGNDLRKPGFRAVPSLRYLQSVPQFTQHFHDSDDEGDESVDAGPTGGLTWDGRVDHGADQARIPLTSSFEMGSTPAQAVAAVKAAPYAGELREAFGANNEAEMHGLELFNDEKKGNCAACHISQRAKDGSPPQFSDFGLIALGVPRNRALPINKDPKYYDLGACGPERTDLKGQSQYCGIFRTPSLRNVATRKVFFHNGIYHSLDEAVRFYVQRDTNPEKFYPSVHGKVQKFDDLPKRYWANVNTEPPFDRKPGEKPAMNEAEIKDVVAFLNTLTDGYQAAK
jgi:cytochrome c peroxidase